MALIGDGPIRPKGNKTKQEIFNQYRDTRGNHTGLPSGMDYSAMLGRMLADSNAVFADASTSGVDTGSQKPLRMTQYVEPGKVMTGTGAKPESRVGSYLHEQANPKPTIMQKIAAGLVNTMLGAYDQGPALTPFGTGFDRGLMATSIVAPQMMDYAVGGPQRIMYAAIPGNGYDFGDALEGSTAFPGVEGVVEKALTDPLVLLPLLGSTKTAMIGGEAGLFKLARGLGKDTGKAFSVARELPIVEEFDAAFKSMGSMGGERNLIKNIKNVKGLSKNSEYLKKLYDLSDENEPLAVKQDVSRVAVDRPFGASLTGSGVDNIFSGLYNNR